MKESAVHNDNLDGRSPSTRQIKDLYRVLEQRLEAAEEGEDKEKIEAVLEKVVDAGRKLPGVLEGMIGSWNPSLDTIQTGVSHIKEVVRLQQKGEEVNIHAVRFSVPQLLDDLRLLSEDIVKKQQIVLHEQVNMVTTEVRLPRNQLLQALINLIKNSVESIEERVLLKGLPVGEGRIELTALTEGAWLTFIVSDNGNGIDPVITDNLLRFGFTTKSQGSGFGLHATGNFVVSCGGTISIESEGIGMGATVSIRLPNNGGVKDV
ncbi:MAG: ATP-binding protein [Gammaproteobacteria bacterium]|jgi:signal transduction histidine kinase|nr:ATP-binding protein [Gammaproteobacteria bacterium]MBT3843569.1 ATP-binding protein [Gammaproteobacteria bacterium]MBT4081621.1 ATP-binding protein [Gammaproteobacteria bacterium]MBT5361034.1 ATP-binding protein [Gammaproteobacteria bacterium]MBT5635234.1 ATP-binding protein [Gammaproteobacteria bacterium]